MNDGVRGTYNKNSQIKTLMLKSSLCDYSDAYILVSGTITITRADDAAKRADERKKKEQFLNIVHHSLIA